jgi:lipid-binding SYLF domain-containing protein
MMGRRSEAFTSSRLSAILQERQQRLATASRRLPVRRLRSCTNQMEGTTMKTPLIALAAAIALALGSITGCTTTSKPEAESAASKRQSLEAEVNAALAQLYAQDPSARELVGKARGTLVFPSVVTAGFVVGGSYGQGVLRSNLGSTDGYYKTVAGSVGLLAGADSKAIFLLFMNQEAYDKFKASKGWTVGADASVSMMKVGANAQVDSATSQQAVVGYVLTKGGLMANLSLEGTKISPIDL